MTQNHREVMQQALEALEHHTAIKHPQQRCYRDDAIEALRAALAEPVQEPYDQSALELCEECGWKTRMPDEGCLNCARLQKPVASRLLTDDEIQAEWSLTPQNEKAEGLWFGRRIERLVRDIALAQQRRPLTDEEIEALLPKPDGTAEVDSVRVLVAPGLYGTEYTEADAWKKESVIQVARAIEAAHGIKE